MKDKTKFLYTPKFKLIYSIFQMILFYLSISLFPKYEILTILCVIITYLIPLYIDSYRVKFQCENVMLSEIFLSQFLYYFLPSVASSLLLDFGIYFSGIDDDYPVCIYTICLFIAFLLVTLFQWLKIFVQYKMAKRFHH